MDKSSSPRLTLKFQHIKTNANKKGSTLHRDKSSSNAKYKTYSVSLGTNNDYIDRPLSPGDSSSSNDSDLYDPQLEITTFGSKRSSILSSSVASHGPSADSHRDSQKDLLGHPREHTRDHQRDRWDSVVGRNSHSNSRDSGRDSHSQNRNQLESRQDMRPDLRQDMRPDLRQDIRPDIRQDMRPDLRQDMRPDIRQDMRPDLGQDMRPDLRPDMRPDIRQDMRPDIRQDMRPDLLQDMRPDLRQDMRPDLRQDNRDNKYVALDGHDSSRGETIVNRLDHVTSQSESHSTAKVKQEPGLQESSHAAVPDSQMPTLSQESGPFEPHFEDISDAEDSSEPIDVNMKPLVSHTSHSPHIPVSSQSAQSSGRLQPTSRADVSSSSDTKQTSASLAPGNSGAIMDAASNHPYSPKPSSSGGSTSHGQLSGVDSTPALGMKTEREPLLPSKHRHTRESQAALSSETVTKHIKTEDDQDERAQFCDHGNTMLSVKIETPSPKSDKFNKHSPRTSNDKDVSATTSSGVAGRSMVIQEKDHFVVKAEFKDSDSIPTGVNIETDKSPVKAEREISRSPKVCEKDGRITPSVDQKSPKSVKDNNKAQPPKLDINRASPKPSDRDSRDSWDSPMSDKGSRPPTPKVPPLKIIIPPKASSSVDKETHNLKTLLTKPALPYVINPTQEAEGAVSSAAVNPDANTTSQASSRASSTISDLDTEKGEDNVSSTQGEVNLRSSRLRLMEKPELIPEVDKETEDKESDENDKQKDESKDDGDKDSDKKEESVERRVTRSAFRSQQQQKQEKEPLPQSGNGIYSFHNYGSFNFCFCKTLLSEILL